MFDSFKIDWSGLDTKTALAIKQIVEQSKSIGELLQQHENKLKTMLIPNDTNDIMMLIKEKIFTEAVTSYTFDDLNGDEDIEYVIQGKIINNYSGATYFGLRFNNDSGNNYYIQFLKGIGTAAAGENINLNYCWIGYGEAVNSLIDFKIRFLALSGTSRLIQGYTGFWNTGSYYRNYNTTINWNNSIDNITSIVLWSSQTNAIGAGSRVGIWARRKIIV